MNNQNEIAKNVNPAEFVLASIITSYPDNYYKSALNELLKDETIQIPKELNQVLSQCLTDEKYLNELRSEYISIFDHAKSLTPLYETEYGRERTMFKSNELSDISGFYHAFGFELDQNSTKEMLDHVSVELEFYSLLMMKYLFLKQENSEQGIEIVQDGMKKFMNSHLGRFVSSIKNREGTKNSNFYSKVFAWVNDVINKECERLNIQPEIIEWFDTQSAEENISCGGSVSLTK